MAIKPSSDIVLEVLKAADPLRAQATTQRLTSLGASGVDAADDFARTLDATEPSPADGGEGVPNASGMRDRLSAVALGAAKNDRAARVEVEFEASVLKTFVDAILPKDEKDVYGGGVAGDIWKSMLADQIAKQIAKSGAFGIAKHLFASHGLPGAHPKLSSLPALDTLAGGALRNPAQMLNPAVPIGGDATLLSATAHRS